MKRHCRYKKQRPREITASNKANNEKGRIYKRATKIQNRTRRRPTRRKEKLSSYANAETKLQYAKQ